MKPHGDFTVFLHDNIIECQLKGSFNETGVTAYIESVKDKISQLKAASFAMLIDDIELEGGTPQAYDVLNQYNEWLLDQAIVAKAFIVRSLAQKEILLQQTPMLKKQNIEFFNAKSDALAWLAQQLA